MIWVFFCALCWHQLTEVSHVYGFRMGTRWMGTMYIGSPFLDKLDCFSYNQIDKRQGRQNVKVELGMGGDSIDIAMFEDDSGSITKVDGVRTIQYTADETLAISEARYYIRKYMGNVLRALTKDFDRVYRSRFCKDEPDYKPLNWKDIRAAATESARKSSINPTHQGGKQYMKGSREEAKRLFLRNRLENTLSNFDVPAGAFFRAIDIHAPDWELCTFTDYRPSIAVKQGDGTWLTVESDGSSQDGPDPEVTQLLEDLRQLKRRLESKDKKHFLSAPDVIIHLSVLEKDMPKALGVCLKETEEVILKTIPILKRDADRRKAAKQRMLKENPRLANPNKRRRGTKAKILKKVENVGASQSGESQAAVAEAAAPEGGRATRKKTWLPGTQKVPRYMNQGVSTVNDNWV